PGLRLALVAVGGYGRRELHPYSDIDIMLVCERDSPAVRGCAATFLRLLWDAGLTVGHSIRTPAECGRECRKDLTTATNVLESRQLAGDFDLFEKALRASTAPSIWAPQKFLAGKLEEQRARYRRYDDTAYNLEPNIKEGPGGLRDLHMIAWVAHRVYGSLGLHDLVRLDILQEQEYERLKAARDILWLIRMALHGITGRREDRLGFEYQRVLANVFGYQDQPGRLAVEQFMKQYYRTVKTIELYNEILLQTFRDSTRSGRSRKPSLINRRFQARNGFLEHRFPEVFERYPLALLEVFYLLQQHPELQGVHASTIRVLLANLHRIDAGFRDSLGARSLFMEIMRQPRGITHELRRMNAYGVLGRYIPAFGRITGQMQHDLFHVYTVDEHILFVVRNLRRFTLKEYAHEFPLASQLMQRLVKPERLYLAALFHDIAKGRGGDHSSLGREDAGVFCRHHGLSEYDTGLVCWLVDQHLLMSQTAQKQDITDPAVVEAFARLVGDRERLDCLYLLTVADMRGTSPAVWNSWKDRLLSQLHAATVRVLRRGVGVPIDKRAHAEDLRQDALKLLGSECDAVGVHAFWARLNDEYFLRYEPDSLAWHAQVVVDAGDVRPVVAARYDGKMGGTELFVLVEDQDALFSTLTAALARAHVSVVEARIHTAAPLALDTFMLLDHKGAPLTEPQALQQIEQDIRKALAESRRGAAPGRVRLTGPVRHFPIPTQVHFSPAPHDSGHILLEVIAQDRPGLLNQVAQALAEAGVRLSNARIATYGERAEDLFFITSADPAHAPTAETLNQLKQKILRRLDGDVQDAPGAAFSF
ncbi:MAG TPA: [protein-PII] uridylyltransferase, partial [Acidiferrobacteraceae bacterium]|nr:[protein-PII] uridylyltransferase [Acidiferrobacteraceae bacterium]